MKAITFKLGPEYFSVDIRLLKEIKPFSELKNTYVPNAPSHLRGLVNLRGDLVPVLDLSVTLNINGTDDKDHNVIILSIKGRTVGLLVNSIENILDIRDGELEKPPSSTVETGSRYISGVKRFKDRLLVHLEPEHLLKTNRDVGVVENRKHHRHQTDISIWYAIGIDSKDLEYHLCKVLDISKSGIKLFTQEQLKMGQEISVKFNEENIFSGMVVWSKKINKKNNYNSGIKFRESIETDLKELNM